MALGGGLAASGSGTEPDFAYPPVSDYAAGMQAALAVVSALAGRGRGQAPDGPISLDVSMMESVLAWQAWPLSDALAAGPEASVRNTGPLSGATASYRLYATEDGRHVALGALEPKFWRAFCEAMGRPDWVDRHDDPMPQTALIAEVALAFQAQPLAHWIDVFEGVDCCFEPVWMPEEVVAHPHIAARGLLSVDGGAVKVALPMIVNGARAEPRAPVRDVSAADAIDAWS
jgi:crotonobetainyl-CoA:carnitine CoA-transferase CaiB-like acyl-CoA transferase